MAITEAPAQATQSAGSVSLLSSSSSSSAAGAAPPPVAMPKAEVLEDQRSILCCRMLISPNHQKPILFRRSSSHRSPMNRSEMIPLYVLELILFGARRHVSSMISINHHPIQQQ
mmetsp:Transcript_24385/g.68530  ORF Transcript_24385/g.68530 Transcript_24385/m.68530 type:complete len:114 (+) Transcript_24385:714-1055(+)